MAEERRLLVKSVDNFISSSEFYLSRCTGEHAGELSIVLTLNASVLVKFVM